jgi:hypothetical protein
MFHGRLLQPRTVSEHRTPVRVGSGPWTRTRATMRFHCRCASISLPVLIPSIIWTEREQDRRGNRDRSSGAPPRCTVTAPSKALRTSPATNLAAAYPPLLGLLTRRAANELWVCRDFDKKRFRRYAFYRVRACHLSRWHFFWVEHQNHSISPRGDRSG